MLGPSRSAALGLRLSGTLGAALGAAFARLRLATFILFITAIGRASVRLTAGILPGVVGYIPATTLQVKTVQRYKLLQAPITVRAISQGRVREFLQCFSCLVTSYALILINRQFYSPPTNKSNMRPGSQPVSYIISFHSLSSGSSDRVIFELFHELVVTVDL